jgi:hypothetical protein
MRVFHRIASSSPEKEKGVKNLLLKRVLAAYHKLLVNLVEPFALLQVFNFQFSDGTNISVKVEEFFNELLGHAFHRNFWLNLVQVFHPRSHTLNSFALKMIKRENF